MTRWEKVAEHEAHSGYRRVVSRRFRMPDGAEREYEVKAEGPTAAVLALTSDRAVVLTREYRPGPEQTLLELPGGAVDAGESPEAAARRELLEETGFEPGELRFAGSLFDCAYSTRVRHSFVGLDCRPVADPHPHEDEFIEVVLLPLEDFRHHLRSGRLTDVGAGYLALDFLNLL